MALGALSLSVTSGVQGRPFQAKINGLTTGKVEVLNDGAPGFSTVNGNVMSSGLPYPVSTVVLREYEPGVGQGYRDSRIDIQATTDADLELIAAKSVGSGRSVRRARLSGEVSGGSMAWALLVEDDLGATTRADVTPFPLLGADLDIDFRTQRCFSSGTAVTFASLVTLTRASIATDLFPFDPPGKAYTTFAVDAPVFVPGEGLWTQEATTQYHPEPVNPAPGVRTISLAVGWYTLWCNALGSIAVSGGTAIVGGAGTATNGNPVVFRVVTAGDVVFDQVGIVYAAQIEGGDGPTSFYPVAGTRARDVATGGAAVVAAFNSTTGSFSMNVRGTQATGRNGAAAAPIRVGTGGVITRNTTCDTSFGSITTTGTDNRNFSCGYGSLRSGVTFAIGWDATGRNFCANGGTVTTSATSMRSGTVSSVILGSNNSATHLNGFIRRLTAYGTKPNNAGLRALSAPAAYDFVQYGDSISCRSDAVRTIEGFPPEKYLSDYLGKTVLVAGTEGDSAGAQLARMQNTMLFGRGVIIFAGTVVDANTVADVASMVALCVAAGVPFLVVSPLTRDNISGRSGGANYTTLLTQIATLSSTYGANFLDLRTALVNAYNPADALDALNKTQDCPPASLRTFLNYGYLATAIADGSATSFTLPFTIASDTVIKIGSEYILVTTGSGTSVTACTRGYGGSAAAAHAAGEYVVSYDAVHQNAAGRQVQGNVIGAKIRALGWA